MIVNFSLFNITCLMIIIASSTCCVCELISFDRLPLHTNGANIVDNVGEKVKFSCVNWYGAHMEQFVVNGLHLQTLGNLSQKIAELGFNCVRLPFSSQLVLENPIVPSSALTANPTLIGLSALDMLDETIKALSNSGVLVILNSHSSKAQWCCNIALEDGVWDTVEYPTSTFISVWENLTSRYLNFTNVVGMDLRNELHDFQTKYITWGATQDEATDWKFTSEIAGEAILKINPNSLIIVSGLCFAYDIRKLQENPPVYSVPDRLVFTTHSYSETTWWNLISGLTKISWNQFLILFSILLTLSIISPVILFGIFKENRNEIKRIEKKQVLQSISGWIIGLCVLFFAAGIAWTEAMKQAGCYVMSEDARKMMIVSGIFFGLSLIVLIGSCCNLKRKNNNNDGEKEGKIGDLIVTEEYEGREMKALSHTDERIMQNTSCCCTRSCCLFNFIVVCLVFFAFTIPLIVLAQAVITDQILYFDLNIKWGFENSKIPIWIGEFGGNNANDPWFTSMIQLLNKTELGWAWWAYDGLRWDNYTQSYLDESYGILREDYLGIRHPDKLLALQSVQ